MQHVCYTGISGRNLFNVTWEPHCTSSGTIQTVPGPNVTLKNSWGIVFQLRTKLTPSRSFRAIFVHKKNFGPARICWHGAQWHFHLIWQSIRSSQHTVHNLALLWRNTKKVCQTLWLSTELSSAQDIHNTTHIAMKENDKVCEAHFGA